MSTQIQFRGGTTAQHSVFTGAVREITVDTDKDTLVVHDGATVGGFPVARESQVTALSANVYTKEESNTSLALKVDKVIGKGLSTEDYSTAEKTKLDGLSNYTLPTATSSAIGGVKVNTTVQSIAANAVTTTDSRTYAVQLDASGNALVNVPWSDTNTVYTHPTSGATAGTYKSVTVNSAGHITAGTNPTTLAGYGITDAYTKTEIDLVVGDINSALDIINGQVI